MYNHRIGFDRFSILAHDKAYGLHFQWLRFAFRAVNPINCMKCIMFHLRNRNKQNINPPSVNGRLLLISICGVNEFKNELRSSMYFRSTSSSEIWGRYRQPLQEASLTLLHAFYWFSKF